MIDLTKLTPAPWVALDYLHDTEQFTASDGTIDKSWQIIGDGPLDDPLEGYAVVHGTESSGQIFPERTDLEFIALSMNAFDVMMRRGWGVFPSQVVPGWGIVLSKTPLHASYDECFGIRSKRWPDPFTALIEADKWYKENVEKSA